MLTAREFAEILATYGDIPVSVQLVGPDWCDEAHHNVHCEILFDPDGRRRVAVTATQEMERL